MVRSPLFVEFEKLRHHWGWYVALGIGLVILGVIAFFLAPAATLATVLVLGWLLVISGIMEGIYAFRMRGWGGVFLHLVAGVLGVLVGLLVVTHPVAGALAWTLLFASFFTVIGIFRIIAAAKLRFPLLGLGGVRRCGDGPARAGALDKLAVVRVVVSRNRRGSVFDPAGMVVRRVGLCGAKLSRSNNSGRQTRSLRKTPPRLRLRWDDSTMEELERVQGGMDQAASVEV